MIVKKTITVYRLEDIPYVSHVPYGESTYNKLFEETDEYTLLEYVNTNISTIDFALGKYDSVYQPENKKMCDKLKELKAYLLQKRNDLYDLIDKTVVI